jgi:HK97 gp10 family phage protein
MSVEDDAKELREAFQKAGYEITTAIGKGLEAACLFVEAEAKKNAPVDTGLLRNSITHRVNEEEEYGEVGAAAEYSVFQEFGSSKMQAANDGRGFLTPALNENKKVVQNIIADQLKDAIK